MLKIIFSAIFFVAFTFSNFVAAADKPKVAVMDLGEFRGAYTSELGTENAGTMVVDYIIKALKLQVKITCQIRASRKRRREYFEEQLNAKNLQKAGIISPSRAREIAKILGIDYLIYGNVNNVGGNSSIFEIVPYGGGNFHKVKVRLIIRIMDIKNEGRIVAAAKGEGISNSSEVKVGKDTIFVKIGTAKIPQVSVHNALQKAASDSTHKLLESFFGK